jgi:hypothetical protein
MLTQFGKLSIYIDTGLTPPKSIHNIYAWKLVSGLKK